MRYSTKYPLAARKLLAFFIAIFSIFLFALLALYCLYMPFSTFHVKVPEMNQSQYKDFFQYIQKHKSSLTPNVNSALQLNHHITGDWPKMGFDLHYNSFHYAVVGSPTELKYRHPTVSIILDHIQQSTGNLETRAEWICNDYPFRKIVNHFADNAPAKVSNLWYSGFSTIYAYYPFAVSLILCLMTVCQIQISAGLYTKTKFSRFVSRLSDAMYGNIFPTIVVIFLSVVHFAQVVRFNFAELDIIENHLRSFGITSNPLLGGMYLEYLAAMIVMFELVIFQTVVTFFRVKKPKLSENIRCASEDLEMALPMKSTFYYYSDVDTVLVQPPQEVYCRRIPINRQEMVEIEESRGIHGYYPKYTPENEVRGTLNYAGLGNSEVIWEYTESDDEKV